MRNTVAIYAIVRVYNREQKRSRDEHGGKRGRKRESVEAQGSRGGVIYACE